MFGYAQRVHRNTYAVTNSAKRSLFWLFNATELNQENKIKLEIRGKAQRESARRPKSDWEKLGGGISPASKSRGPNSNALVYAERALST